MKRERKREVGRGEEGRWREEKRRGGSKGGKERTVGKKDWKRGREGETECGRGGDKRISLLG